MLPSTAMFCSQKIEETKGEVERLSREIFERSFYDNFIK